MNQIHKGDPSAQKSVQQRLFRVVLGVCLLALAVSDLAVWRLAAPPYGALCLELRTEVPTNVQVHFDTGQGFHEEQSVIVPAAASPDFQTLYFPLPTEPVLHVRFDPLSAEGAVTLRAPTLVKEKGHPQVRTFNLNTVRPMDGNTEIEMTPDGLQITRQPGAEGSALQLLPLDPPITMQRTASERLRELALVDGLMFALVAAVAYGVCFTWRGATRPADAPAPRRHALAARWLPARWTARLLVLTLGILVAYFAAAQRASYYLEATVACDRDVDMQFYYDGGSGFTEADSVLVKVPASPTPQAVRFPIPVDKITSLRFDPAQAPGTIRITSLVVRSEAENWLYRREVYVFDLHELQPSQQIAELRQGAGFVDIVMADDARDPSTTFALPAPGPACLELAVCGQPHIALCAGLARAPGRGDRRPARGSRDVFPAG